MPWSGTKAGFTGSDESFPTGLSISQARGRERKEGREGGRSKLGVNDGTFGSGQ